MSGIRQWVVPELLRSHVLLCLNTLSWTAALAAAITAFSKLQPKSSDQCLCQHAAPEGRAGYHNPTSMRCRAFVVGLSDEAGAGANVGLAIKVRHAPTWQEVARLDEYVQQTLCGTKPGLPHAASLQAWQPLRTAPPISQLWK